MDYLIGQAVRVSWTTKTLDGTFTNPTTHTFKYNNGTATTTLVAGVDAALVTDTVGHHHTDIALTASATWTWRIICTGAVVAAEQGSFVVTGANLS